jgi:hypothetical protein
MFSERKRKIQPLLIVKRSDTFARQCMDQKNLSLRRIWNAVIAITNFDCYKHSDPRSLLLFDQIWIKMSYSWWERWNLFHGMWNIEIGKKKFFSIPERYPSYGSQEWTLYPMSIFHIPSKRFYRSHHEYDIFIQIWPNNKRHLWSEFL